MQLYAKVIDEATGTIEVGTGDPNAVFEQVGDTVTLVKDFYESIGMTLMDVEQGYDGAWYLEGKAPTPPAPTVEEILKMYEDAVQAHLDATAQSKGYDNTYTCLSYLSSTDEIWHRESNAFNAWRDKVWRKCHEIMNYALSGEITPPSVAELIQQLPVIDWGETA